ESKRIKEALKDVDYSKLGMTVKEAEKAVSESIDKQKAKVDELKNKLTTAYNEIKNVLRNTSTLIVAAAIASSKTFIDLDKQVRKVQTISNDGFRTIQDNVRNLATDTGTSVNDLTEALYQTVSAIGDVEGKYEVLNTANKLAVGGFTTTTNSVDVLTTVLNAYKMRIIDVEKISDLLIQTQNKGKTTVDLLATSLGNVIPTAAATGVSFEQLSTAMALITSNGIGTAESATALNAMFNELAKNSTEASKAFKKAAGMGFVEYMKAGGDLGDALMILKEQADKTGNSLLDLFNIRSFKGAQTIVDSFDRYTIFKDAMSDATGVTETAFEKMQESLSQQIKIITANLKEISISFGASLAPTIREITEEIKKIDFKKTFSKENIESIIATGKAIVGVYLAMKALSIGHGIGKPIIKYFGEVTSAAMASKIAITALGTALTGLAVGGVVVGIGYLATKYIAFKNEVEAVTKAMDFSTGSWDQQTQAIERQVEALNKLIEANKKGIVKDRSMKIEEKALTGQYQELKEYQKAYEEANGKLAKVEAELYSNISANRRKYLEKQLSELRENAQKTKEEYNQALEEIRKNAELKKVKIEFDIKREPLEKEMNEIQGYLESLNKGIDFKVLQELGKNTNYTDLVNQYKELERNAGSAAEKAEILKKIQDQLKEDKEIITKISFQIDQDEIKKLEALKNNPILTDEETQRALQEQYTEIKRKFDEEFKDGLSIEVKLQMQNNLFKDIKDLTLKGLKNEDAEKTLQRALTYIQEFNTGTTKPTINTGKTISDEIKKIVDEYKKTLVNAPKLAEGLGLDEAEQIKSKLSTIEKAYTDLINNGADGMAKKLIPEMQKLRKETEELSKEDKIRNLFKDYREDLAKFPTMAEILGLDEEAQLKQKITNIRNLLVGLYNADGSITDKESFEKYNSQLKILIEEEEAAKKLAEMKKKEETATQDLINIMGNFGNDMIKLGQQLNSSFIEAIGNITNSISIIGNGMNQYQTSGGLGAITGMFSKGSSMLGLVNGFSSLTGIMTAVSGIAGIGSLASSALSSLSGKDKKKKIEKNNEENKKAFEESTKVLLTFTEAIKSNITAINSYSNNMLGFATNNTTLAGIEKVQKNFDNYINAMVEAGA
ncbi:MAG: phage tail tape measure protein, partial [Fusobacterium ulcerans]|uniref:phage tail tape measure protein n=1 Tax=Fusobacterium ulcerans TaxID=861 RepID=UPI003A896D2A